MRFTIGFEKKDTKKLYKMWDEIIETHKWSEGKFTKSFEEKWNAYNNSTVMAFCFFG